MYWLPDGELLECLRDAGAAGDNSPLSQQGVRGAAAPIQGSALEVIQSSALKVIQGSALEGIQSSVPPDSPLILARP